MDGFDLSASLKTGLRTADLAAINSLTKYGSISTYHALDPATGKLTETVAVAFGCPSSDAPVVVTEKIDGTNARVVLFPDGSWLIGSREELLTAQGDLIANPAQGIVAALDEAVADLAADWPGVGAGDDLVVLYLEVYGGKTSAAAANYTGEGNVGVALFDIGSYVGWQAILATPMAEVAAWRDRVGPRWWTTEAVARAAWHPFDLVPALATPCGPAGAVLPRSLGATRQVLDALLPGRRTRCALDDKEKGVAEGVVVRTADRGKIAKLKFRDYDRTLGGKR